MAHHRITDPAFWDLEPEFLKPVQDACKPHGLDIVHFVMGDPDDPCTPVAAVLRMPPGYELARHAHPVVRFEVIVQGSLQVGGEVYGPGDVMMSPAGEMYGPHIAGPEGCTTVEVFSSIRGTGNLVSENGESVSYR